MTHVVCWIVYERSSIQVGSGFGSGVDLSSLSSSDDPLNIFLRIVFPVENIFKDSVPN